MCFSQSKSEESQRSKCLCWKKRSTMVLLRTRGGEKSYLLFYPHWTKLSTFWPKLTLHDTVPVLVPIPTQLTLQDTPPPYSPPPPPPSPASPSWSATGWCWRLLTKYYWMASRFHVLDLRNTLRNSILSELWWWITIHTLDTQSDNIKHVSSLLCWKMQK